MSRLRLIVLALGGLVLVVGFCILASNVFYYMGMDHRKHQSPEKAEKEFHMAVLLNPFNAEAHYQRSLCLPRNWPPHMGWEEDEQMRIPHGIPNKENQEIEKELKWVILLKPNHAMAHYDLGEVLAVQGKDEEGVKQFQETLRLNPNIPPKMHCKIGERLRYVGKLEEAEKEYREAIRLQPNGSPESSYMKENLMRLLMEEEKYSEAEQEVLSWDITCDSKDYFLVMIYEKQGDITEGENKCRKIIRSSGNRCAYGSLGILLAREGKFQAAEDTLRKGLRLDPEDADMHYKLGCCYALWGKKEEAILSLQKAADKGYNQAIEEDELLNGVRGDPRFNKIVERVKRNRPIPL